MSSKARSLQRAQQGLYLKVNARSLAGSNPRRHYATQSSSTTSGRPSRRAISVTTDDGRYHWSELSTGEKAARTTQQSFNFVFVTAGAVGTVSLREKLDH